MAINQNNQFYIVSLIISLISGCLVILNDFGGWEEIRAYDSNYYVWIGSENIPFYAKIIIVAITLGLFYTAYISFLGMQGNITETQSKLGFQVALTTLIITLVSAVAFIAQVADAVSWWLDTGFYAGVIGSGVSAFFLNQAQKANIG